MQLDRWKDDWELLAALEPKAKGEAAVSGVSKSGASTAMAKSSVTLTSTIGSVLSGLSST